MHHPFSDTHSCRLLGDAPDCRSSPVLSSAQEAPHLPSSLFKVAQQVSVHSTSLALSHLRAPHGENIDPEMGRGGVGSSSPAGQLGMWSKTSSLSVSSSWVTGRRDIPFYVSSNLTRQCLVRKRTHLPCVLYTVLLIAPTLRQVPTTLGQAHTAEQG